MNISITHLITFVIFQQLLFNSIFEVVSVNSQVLQIQIRS